MIVKKQIRTPWKIKLKTVWGSKKLKSNHILRDFCDLTLKRGKNLYFFRKIFKELSEKLWNLNKPASNHFFRDSCDLLKVWGWNKNLKKPYFFLHLLDSSNKIFNFQWRSPWLNFQFYWLSAFSGWKAQFSFWPYGSKRFWFAFREQIRFCLNFEWIFNVECINFRFF